jgi:hypothetical protein
LKDSRPLFPPAVDCLVDALEVTLETAGVEFIAENGGGPCVRLKKAKAE